MGNKFKIEKSTEIKLILPFLIMIQPLLVLHYIEKERERERNEISLGILGSREGRRSDFGSELFN